MTRQLVTVDVYEPGEDHPEAEAIVVDVEGTSAVIELDDGTRLVGDRAELIDALSPAQPLRGAA